MANYFLDSNAIIKYYITEPGSTWVRQLVNDPDNLCIVCEISLAEVAAALAQAQRSKRFGNTFMRNTYTRFRADLRQRLFFAHPVTLGTAELASNIAMRRPLKGCDALQVAAAILTDDEFAPELSVVFVSGDKQALEAARSEGLSVADPFDHTDEDQRS
jgi:predicted nucleic acid-binding protein